LLASSAFPGVFRPRWPWEVHNGVSRESQYIDGGVMDNLPLDAVAQVMYEAGAAIKRRPVLDNEHVPHLLFAASLEVNVGPQGGQADVKAAQEAARNWVRLWQRARRLSYNHKLETFLRSQRDIRRIYESQPSPPWEPLDIEVVAVKPEWLCSTFAMHPMLGFRRSKQAASIAHGCASTLAQFARCASVNPHWTEAWGIQSDFLPKFDPSSLSTSATGRTALVPRKHGGGNCWFRYDSPCPFSRQELQKLHLPDVTRKELEGIYRACRLPETHRPSPTRG
jgi:hypothetical protein